MRVQIQLAPQEFPIHCGKYCRYKVPDFPVVFLQNDPVLSTVIPQDFPVVKDRIVLYLIPDNPMILSFFAGKSCVILQDVSVLLTSFPITLHTV